MNSIHFHGVPHQCYRPRIIMCLSAWRVSDLCTHILSRHCARIFTLPLHQAVQLILQRVQTASASERRAPLRGASSWSVRVVHILQGCRIKLYPPSTRAILIPHLPSPLHDKTSIVPIPSPSGFSWASLSLLSVFFSFSMKTSSKRQHNGVRYPSGSESGLGLRPLPPRLFGAGLATATPALAFL